MNEQTKLAAAVAAMGALPMPIGDTATAAELGKDTRGTGESTPAVRPASKVTAVSGG
ncbi:hypothetical protein EES45_23160 [Streptomyces sp. ADI97-07]|uniref:hypothetical protein n=1 Tax=Streptomyces sp. ADI97-07 TaxID=1522762 RepID=UPI000FA5C79A|nr:hypothetical protein [Streptomyces sp. ADI97-07]RPK76394.1 hypothetical protein EES45_23160 [Streptomyces sp. ADI97-07]